MILEKLWDKYRSDGDFNFHALPESIIKKAC